MTSGDYTMRLIDLTLDEVFSQLPAVMLIGPRAVGKTTTAIQRAASVLHLDQPDQAEVFGASPDAVLAAQREPVLIDEWQDAPASMGAVKRAVDATVGAGRFLITGSVRSRLGPASWPGTGRVVPLRMYGMTVAEREQATSLDALTWLCSPDEPRVGELQPAPSIVDVVREMMRGGFPDAIGLTGRARELWYEGYVDQLIHRDVADLAEIRSSIGLARMLQAVALNTAGLPAVSALAAAAGVSHPTAQAYLQLLEELFVIERVPAWHANEFTRLVKTPKYYVVDPGLCAHLAHDDSARLLTSADRLGRMVDTFVAAQLRPLVTLSSPRIRMHHLRDRNGEHEIDIVLDLGRGRVVGIEVKAGAVVEPRSSRHLAWLRDSLGDRFVRGFVLHSGAAAYPLGERIWAVPIAALWRGLP